MLLLAMLAGFLPEAAAQNPQAPVILESPDHPNGRVEEGEAIRFTVSRVGDTSQPLTVNVRIEGKVHPDHDGHNPDPYNPTDANDFDRLSTTSLTIPAGDTKSHGITIYSRQDTPYEPEERFNVVASGTYGGTPFEVKKEGRLIEDLRPTVGFTHAVPFNITEGDSGTVTFTLSHPVPHPVRVPWSIMSRHRTSTETAGDGGATMADHMMRSGTVTIPENGGTATLDVLTVEDSIPEPDEQFVIRFGRPSHSSFEPRYNSIDFYTLGGNEQTVTVTIVDDDTPPAGQRYVYLSGGASGQYTRGEVREGGSTPVTATLVGEAPSSDVSIPLKFTGFPAGEATSSDYSILASVTIKGGEKSGSVTLRVVDDSSDERYRELLAVEIDDGAANWPQGYTKGDRSRFEVVMLDNDRTSASLQNLSRAALTEAPGARTATFQVNVTRRPKGDATGTAPFTGVDLAEGDARVALGYTGVAKRGDDYTSNDTITIPKASGNLPGTCSASGEAVACTVTLTVIDDNLYERGSGTTETVRIDINAGGSSFHDGIVGAAGNSRLNLTIEDNDAQPHVLHRQRIGARKREPFLHCHARRRTRQRRVREHRDREP